MLLDPARGSEGETPLTRLTPEVPFPETERNVGHYYANPWPLSEDVYQGLGPAVGRGEVARLRIVGVPPKVQPRMNEPNLGVSAEALARLHTWMGTYAQSTGSFSATQEQELEAFRHRYSFLLHP